MSTPDKSATTAAPERTEWLSKEDEQALFAAAWWFDMVAPSELLAQYKGMHVGVHVDKIVDADRDREALFRRLDADPDKFPPNRVLPRYVPTDEEAWDQLW